MNAQQAVELIAGAITTAAWICLPLLAGGFVIGIVVSLVQILTSSQDPAVGTVPRLAGILVLILLSAGWMTARLVDYSVRIFSSIPQLAR
jgi:flagellar biosynthetic protein FliQ